MSSLGDVNVLRTILLYHFSNGVFINGGLEGGVTNLLKTIQGHNLQVLSVRTTAAIVFSVSAFVSVPKISMYRTWIIIFLCLVSTRQSYSHTHIFQEFSRDFVSTKVLSIIYLYRCNTLR